MRLDRYTCVVGDKCIKPTHFNGEPTRTFRDPATCGKTHKLYVMMKGCEFCYVGIARTSISTRMRTGCKPNTAHGYHGYDLKGLTAFDLYVYVLPEHADDNFPEAVEAELVYLIRNKTHRWPTRQHEIHFHNYVKGAKPLARELYRRLAGG